MDFMESLSQEDRGWKLSNLLSDQMSLAGNTETALSNGLGLILSVAGYNGGTILVQFQSERLPVLAVSTGGSERWQSDISSPKSALKEIACDVLNGHNGDI